MGRFENIENGVVLSHEWEERERYERREEEQEDMSEGLYEEEALDELRNR